MEMFQLFHMNKGQGETSYAKNCSVQKKILSATKPFVGKAILDYLGEDIPENMAITDLGCGSGSNALTVVSDVMDVVDIRCCKLGCKSPQFMVYLNDLPGNDFNEVFASLSGFHNKLKQEKGADFGPCFVVGVPGSFHGRLFPNQSLHFVHSSSSLHWLSQVPSGLGEKDDPEMQNKGKIHISNTSPSGVVNAYKQQFHNDFNSFLRSRSEEVIAGGRMVLAFMGRRSTNDPMSIEPCYHWELIGQSLMTMVSKDLIEEDKVDTFNAPFYEPRLEELQQLVMEEASFTINRIEGFEVEWDGGEIQGEQFDNSCATLTRGERQAKMHRAVLESMLEHHFGEEILDELFKRYGKIVDDQYSDSNKNCTNINFVISLIRN